jgi:hypothetical protein
MGILCTSDSIYNNIADIEGSAPIVKGGHYVSTIEKARAILLSLAAIAAIPACDAISPIASNPPAFDTAQAALELQAASLSLQLTQAAMNSQTSAAQPT